MDTPNGDCWRILLVDDDEEDFIITSAMLRKTEGRRVVLDWAASFEDGQQKIQDCLYDAVLVDYDLGGKTGIDLIRSISEVGYPAPLILFTGRGTYQVDLEAMSAGASLYLTKNEVNSLLLERSIRYAIERKQVEDQLEYHAHLLANVFDPVVAADSEMRITYWNKAAEDVFGWTEQEALGQESASLFQTRPTESTREAGIKQLLERGSLSGEAVLHRKDGVPLNIQARTSVLRGSRGEFQGVVSALRDVTERRRAAQAEADDLADMRRLHEVSTLLDGGGELPVLFQNVLEAAVAITKADMGHLMTVEPEKKTLSMAAQHGFDSSFREYFEKIDPGHPSTCGMALKQGRRFMVEDLETSTIFAGSPQREAVLAAGVRAVQSTPLISRSGEVVGILSTHWRVPTRLEGRTLRMVDLLARQAADFIAHRQAYQARLHTEEMFEKMFHSSPTGMALSRLEDGRYIDVNESHASILGYSRSELLGRKSTELGIYERLEDREEIVRQVRENGSVRDMEIRVRTKRDEARDILFSVESIDFGGTPYALSTLVDITARKQAEEAFRMTNERYRTLFDSIDEGFCIIEMIFSEEGKPVDYRFLEVNQAFERQTGLHQVQGRRVREMIPGHEEYWFEIYGQVSLSGEAVSFENRARALNRLYRVNAFRVGRPEERCVAVLFKEILNREQA